LFASSDVNVSRLARRSASIFSLTRCLSARVNVLPVWPSAIEYLLLWLYQDGVRGTAKRVHRLYR